MNECERLEQLGKRLMNACGLDSKRIEIWKKWSWLGEKTRTFWPQQKIQGKGLHRWCEAQVLIGWNVLVSHHESIISHPATKARFASLAWFWHTRAWLCVNRVTKIAWACAACCLDIVWNPGLIAVRFVQRAHRLWSSVCQSQSETEAHTLNTSLTREKKIDKFRSSRFGDFIRLGANFPPHWGCFFNSLRNQLCYRR